MELTDAQVRGWLTNLYEPGALGADPVIREVLRAHGRMADGSDLVVSREAREFLHALIEQALMPRSIAAPEQVWRPYRVLTLAYVNPHSHHTTARLLNLSSRHLTREKTRAIRLLRVALEQG